MKNKETGKSVLATNRKARFNYFLSDFVEAGVELKGTEIKSLRKNGASLSDAYISFRGGEAFLVGMHIAPYDHGNIFNHDPLRVRKLLMHAQEILKLQGKVKEKGYTILPTKVYLSRGKAKIEVALGKGKKLYDKRETIKERDIQRDLEKLKKSF